MSEIETPLCQELHASPLDSNDIRAWRSLAYRLERGLTLLDRSALPQEAVPMLMFCPRCFKQHIDAPKGEWTNPPHATHTCQFCGLLWRPSNENTAGVKEIQQLEPKHAERIAASFPPERPPSGGMVMVPREPTDAIVWAICEHSDAPIDRERCLRCPAKEPTYYGEGTRGCRALAEDQFRAALSAAEAEGRKSEK